MLTICVEEGPHEPASSSLDYGFRSWREQARALLQAEVAPKEILWHQQGEAQLFGTGSDPIPPPKAAHSPEAHKQAGEHENDDLALVPKEFLRLARTISHHESAERWALLYDCLWRLCALKQRHLLQLRSDPLCARLFAMRKEISRDIHKMHAFVRFKKVAEPSSSGREQFIAWFEPSHRVLPLAAPFFQKRFTSMDWAILTPSGSACWDGKKLLFGPAAAKVALPEDKQEELWRSYYKSIFNPARLKLRMMQTEMPKKYWHNLPEAELIAPLIAQSKQQVASMHAQALRAPSSGGNNRYLRELRQLDARGQKQVLRPEEHIGRPIDELRGLAQNCQACPLYQAATGTVFGEGPAPAPLMIVGEQPGDQEDLTGRPFVGPAGQLLDTLLEQVGIERSQCYLTNAVKHFKFIPRAKERLHRSPSTKEISLCKPWLLAELEVVRPRVLLLLGASSAKALLGSSFQLSTMRGLQPRQSWPPLMPQAERWAPEHLIVSFHPSYLLRSKDPALRREREHALCTELRLARQLASPEQGSEQPSGT